MGKGFWEANRTEPAKMDPRVPLVISMMCALIVSLRQPSASQSNFVIDDFKKYKLLLTNQLMYPLNTYRGAH